MRSCVMCLARDTTIRLADGRLHVLEDLAASELPHVIYSCTPGGRVMMSLAHVVAATENACCRITLDNDRTIICSVDQQFMLRDGSYADSGSVAVGASLMPLYTSSDRDGYTLVQQNYSGRLQKAHWIVARSGLLGPIP